jgi:dimethylaniline monooxygenase (N-oxide forming)
MKDSKVCILGAGCSGLVAAKILHERGIAYDCFEKGSGIGGLWRYNNDNGMSAAYKSLHINTSRDKMAFSDFPMPQTYPDFPHHSQVLSYFESYVDHFEFRDKITFQTEVSWIQPLPDGTYDVTTKNPAGQQRIRNYKTVMVANGHHWKPRKPEFAGEFTGRCLHSHDYREASSMEGKSVLVVGMGNSGCDIACDISRVAERTYLSTRRGAHIIPKYIFGRPLDVLAPPWMWRTLPFRLFQMLFGAALRLSRGKLKRFNLPMPEHRILEEHPTISSDLLNQIGHGKIAVKPNIQELDGSKVHFIDGTHNEIDIVIYAIGYHSGG